MADDGDRLDGGARSVIGGGLPRRVGGAGDRFDKGNRASKRLEAAKNGDMGPVDARNPQGLRPYTGMDVAAFLGVKALTDLELAEQVLALKVYQANGLTLARAAKRCGVPIGLARSWLAEARHRRLTLPALDAARTYVEENLVGLAVEGLERHLKQGNLEASLGTLRGTGVLRNSDTPIDGRLPTTLNVQIVDADGVIISVGGPPQGLEGVVGVAKQHRLDVPVERGELV